MDQRNRPFRFSIQGGPFGDVDALRDHARMIETLGYHELFTSDHIGAPGGEGRKGGMFVVDPFLPLMVAAEATTNLRVGTLVLNNEFYNPALLARTVATADRLTKGRVVLGLGTGYAAPEHSSIGEPIRPPGPRVSRFEESLQILRALLDTGSVDHAGDFESAQFDDLGVEPVQRHVPLLIGGHGRRVLGVAARHADIVQFTGIVHGPNGDPGTGGFALSRIVERGHRLSEDAGDRDASIERSALVQLAAVGETAPSLSELAEQFELSEEEVADTPFILAGSVQQIVDKIERIREAVGITHYVVRDPRGFAPVIDALRP